MKIIFNLHDVGLGNNGGSRTLVRCAETLADLGVEVVMSSNYPSRFSWHSINNKVKVTQQNTVPNGDVVIATGYRSVKSTILHRACKKLYYVRGLELWQDAEHKLVASFKSLPCIVNSEWLLSYMVKLGIPATLLYPGLDDFFYDEKRERKPYIGGLYHHKHKTKNWQEVEEISVAAGYKSVLLNRDIKNASPDETRKLYNDVKVWVASTELEGLHNPPIEASLSGCALVCCDAERGGMKDYAKHNDTALVYPLGQPDIGAFYVKQLMNNEEWRKDLVKNMQSRLKTKIGSRTSNMKRLIELINE